MAIKRQTAREWQDEKFQRAFSFTEGIPHWNTFLRDGDFRFDDKSMQRIIAARELLLLEIQRARVLRSDGEITSNVVHLSFRG